MYAVAALWIPVSRTTLIGFLRRDDHGARLHPHHGLLRNVFLVMGSAGIIGATVGLGDPVTSHHSSW